MDFLYIIRFVHHRKDYAFASRINQLILLRSNSLLIDGYLNETKVHSVGRMGSYNMLQVCGTFKGSVSCGQGIAARIRWRWFLQDWAHNVCLIAVDRLLWKVPFIVNLLYSFNFVDCNSAHVAKRERPREMLQSRLYVSLQLIWSL